MQVRSRMQFLVMLLMHFLACVTSDIGTAAHGDRTAAMSCIRRAGVAHLHREVQTCHITKVACFLSLLSAMPSPLDDACVAWAASSRDFDVGAALVMLRRAGLPRPFAAAARASSLVSRALSAAKGARLGRLLQALAELDQVRISEQTEFLYLLLPRKPCILRCL